VLDGVFLEMREMSFVAAGADDELQLFGRMTTAVGLSFETDNPAEEMRGGFDGVNESNEFAAAVLTRRHLCAMLDAMARHKPVEIPPDLRTRLETARLDLLALFRALDRMYLTPDQIPQRLIRQLFELDADYVEALWGLDQPPGKLQSATYASGYTGSARSTAHSLFPATEKSPSSNLPHAFSTGTRYPRQSQPG